MSASAEEREDKEKATVLNHIAKAAFPADFLAPWMSVYDRRTSVVIAGLRTISDVGEELDRRQWLDEHKEELFHPKDSPTVKIASIEAHLRAHPEDAERFKERLEALRLEVAETEEEVEELEFDSERVRGGGGMYGYCLAKLAMHTHNLAPSIGGLGRKQAMSLGMAQKSGVAVEPKKRSLWQKVTGQGKDEEKVSGV